MKDDDQPNTENSTAKANAKARSITITSFRLRASTWTLSRSTRPGEHRKDTHRHRQETAKHPTEVQHSGPRRVTGATIERKELRLHIISVHFPRKGDWSEHVQQLYSEPQQQMEEDTLLVKGDSNAQVAMSVGVTRQRGVKFL